MSGPDEALARKAYYEAGCGLALFRICFNLLQGDRRISSNFKVEPTPESAVEDLPTLLRYARGFTGLSLHGERTNYWNDTAYFWRASHTVLLGGCAAVRVKWKITQAPALSDAEFEKAYIAQRWFYTDLDRDPGEEQILREALEGLRTATRQLEDHWQAVDILAGTLLEKSELSARETFRILAANLETGRLDDERQAWSSSPPSQVNAPDQAPPAPRVAVDFETIQDWDLERSRFLGCCDGNGDAFPFKCPACGRLMVFCYECDTLYPELDDPGVMQRQAGRLRCPQCHHEFEDGFMKNPACYATPAEWRRAGLESLLTQSARNKLLRGRSGEDTPC